MCVIQEVCVDEVLPFPQSRFQREEVSESGMHSLPFYRANMAFRPTSRGEHCTSRMMSCMSYKFLEPEVGGLIKRSRPYFLPSFKPYLCRSFYNIWNGPSLAMLARFICFAGPSTISKLNCPTSRAAAEACNNLFSACSATGSRQQWWQSCTLARVLHQFRWYIH